MLLIDGHVHIYCIEKVGELLDHAYENFQKIAKFEKSYKEIVGVLFLADVSYQNNFDRIIDLVSKKKSEKSLGRWKFCLTEENNTIFVKDRVLNQMLIVNGRQVVSSEGLEVLTFGENVSTKDHLPIKKIIEMMRNEDGIAIIPWGFGKWVGKRGIILLNLINSSNNNEYFLGDNGCRMAYWPIPEHFKLASRRGINILAGSDPMPLRNEQRRVGSYGFSIDSRLSQKNPFQTLKDALNSPDIKQCTYGKLSNPKDFIIRQIKIRIFKS